MVEKEEVLAYIYAKLAEAPRLARERTQDGGKPFGHRRVYPRIKKHVDDFLMAREKQGNIENRVIVLPGLRGVGKTTLLLQIYEYLTLSKRIEQERVLYFSADELRDYLGARISDILKVFMEDILRTSLVNLDKQVFLLIDEAHFDKDWSLSVKIVYDQTKNVFLLLTGSSALSMEMSVDLARRAKKEIMFPMNFSEYIILKYKKFPPSGTSESIREVIFSPSDKSLNYATNKWNELKREMLSIGKPLEKEFEYFISSGGLPFGINLDEKDTYGRIFSMIDRVIEKDIFTIHSFNTETKNLITRIIYYLALQKPGGTSDVKLAQRLGASSKLVRDILNVLEKTHLVFNIKPYRSAGKIIRKPWKYYFLSSSINAAIRYKLGVYDLKDRDMLGIFAENLVASYFFRMKETVNRPTGIFYDSEKEGVDFLIRKEVEEIIPVEVTIGKESEYQIKKAIKKYHSKYGIAISNTSEISMKDDIIHVPITFFSFV